MKGFVLPALAIAALSLAACETATPYQPLHARNSQASGGYSDQQIEANRWRVTFAGNDLTSRETVERYLLYRSAELTLAQGGDWFSAAQRSTDKQTETYVDPLYGPGFGYWGPQWGFYRRGYGWGYGRWGDPFWGPGGWGPRGPIDIDQTSQYQASAEIIIGKGAKPDARAFDARSVVEHLGPSIKRPTA
jgi:hypothetical protein